MDHLSSFINEYNIYASVHDIVLIDIKDKDIKESSNMYDNLEKIYPTVKKYILDTKFKIYSKGKQLLINRNIVCNVCNESFCHINTVTEVKDNTFVHNNCCDNSELTRQRLMIKNIMEDKMSKNDICLVCLDKCLVNQKVVMSDDNFFHVNCCVKRIVDAYVDKKCYICSKLIYTSGSLIKYYEKDGKQVHINCTTRCPGIILTSINMRMSQCSFCKFYIDDKRHIHKICENTFKTMKE